jgi:hypothetical protein
MSRVPARRARPVVAHLALSGFIVALAISQTALAAPTADGPSVASAEHLVISEVMTGGASASDEFVELYNPTATSLALDGFELVYVTASGATITRKAAWGPGAELDSHRHVLVANEAGIFAGVADMTYAGGLAATGGSMALRAVAAPTGVDAVGWGTAASSWLEGQPAPAPPAGSSLERLPGGPLGSGQDSEDNVVDFVVRSAPDPQNSASPPAPDASPSGSPGASHSPAGSIPASPSSSLGAQTPSPTPGPSSSAADPSPTSIPSISPTPEPTPDPSATPASTPSPAPMTVAEARALPDGSPVVVAGITLSSSAFTEGGGYLADATGGIALLLADGSVPRGVELVVSGIVDDRFAQRTMRSAEADVRIIGPGAEPAPIPVSTGVIGEPHEGQLVSLEGTIDGSPTSLSAGLAYEVDDGSGPVRVIVGPDTGIDTSPWQAGALLSLTGVVGQRDSSGTGTDGYRVQPRDPADVASVLPPPTPEPTPTTTPSTPSPSASSPGSPVIAIAEARDAPVGTTVRIRGVVTLPTGLVESGSAIVADPSGGILVRTSSNQRLGRGQLVELVGTRSTRSGMASLRVGQPHVVLGTQPDPAAPRRATGQVREADEAILVTVRGLVADGPRRTSGGSLTLTVNDGSGELRVFVASGTGIPAGSMPGGSWVEVRGVVGQQTTGSAPNSGYRLWPRDRDDVRVIAPATVAGRRVTSTNPAGSAGSAGPGEPGGAPIVRQPRLGGATALAPQVRHEDAAGQDVAPAPTELHAPLAVSIGGLAGLAALAWRHGTWIRLWDDVGSRVGRRLVTFRTGTRDEGADESYTLAP